MKTRLQIPRMEGVLMTQMSPQPTVYHKKPNNRASQLSRHAQVTFLSDPLGEFITC